MSKKLFYISIALIIICGLAAYANSISAPFVLDDHLLITGNGYIKSLPRAAHFFTENIAAGAGADWGFWRPLQMFTYTFDYALWGLFPAGYHLTNVLLHILVALCIWYMVSLLFLDGLTALLTGLLFVVHPLHTEAVTYVSGRADELAFLCMLTALIFYIKYTRGPRGIFFLFSLTGFLAALLSRENSLVFPFLLLVYHAACRVRVKPKRLLPFFVLAALYVCLRLTVLAFVRPDAVGFLQRLPGFFVAAAGYARLLIFPSGLHMEYGKKLFLWSDWRLAAGVAVVAMLAYAMFRSRKGAMPVRFGLMWLAVSGAPQANLLYPLNAYMAEHWLYIPSMGVFLIAAYFLSGLYKRKQVRILSLVLITLLIVSYGVLTVKQNSVWRDPVTLYTDTLRYAPDSSRVMICLGNELSRKKDYDNAIVLYRKAIIRDPGADAYFNLGNAYRLTGRAPAAIAAYRAALACDPRHAPARHNLDNMVNSFYAK